MMEWEEMRTEVVKDLEKRIETDTNWKNKLQQCNTEEEFTNISLEIVLILAERQTS